MSGFLEQTKAEIDAILALLNEKKATKRKEGVTRLTKFLDSPEYLRALDAETIKLRPTVSVGVLTWPGLAVKFSTFVEGQVDEALKKERAPDAALSKTLRLLLELAEDEKRSGSKGLLLRRASKLFTHVTHVLKRSGLSSTSPLCRDSVHILKLLLADPDYCAAVVDDDWIQLVETHIKWIKNAKAAVSNDDGIRVLGMLGSLLSDFTVDPPVTLLKSLLKTFAELGPTLESLMVRIGSSCFAAVNAFLSSSGVDVATQCPALHAALHAATVKALRGRDVKLKDRAVEYVRMQLRLGGVGAEQLEALLKWAASEAAQPQWKPTPHAPIGAPLTQSQHALLCLLADIYVHSAGIAEGGLLPPAAPFSANGERNAGGTLEEEAGTSRAAKRTRREPPLSSLGASAAGTPAEAAPVAAFLLLNHAQELPREEYRAWLLQASAALPKALDNWAASADARKSGALLWLLRLLHALALAAPDEPPPTEADSAAWSDVWHTISSRHDTLKPPAPELEASLWVATAIAANGLCQLPSNPHELWGFPLMAFPPTSAGLHLAAAALRAGVNSAAHAGLWEAAVVDWAVQGGADSGAVSAVVQAFLRFHEMPAIAKESYANSAAVDFSGAPGVPSKLPAGTSPVWAWWEEDAAVERRMAGMVRGVAYMRRKARLAVFENARRQAEASAEAAAGPSAPAGGQMHAQAAEALRRLVADSAQAAPNQPTQHTQQRTEWMHSVLSACAAALDAAAVALQQLPNAEQREASLWFLDKPLAQEIQGALREVGPVLAEAICTMEGLTKAETAALDQAMGALGRYQTVCRSFQVASELQGALDAFEDTFSMDASTAAAAAVATATQGRKQFTNPLPAAGFDDDLDVAIVSAVTQGAIGAQLAFKSSASLARVYKMRCAAVLVQLAPLSPIAVGHTATTILETAAAPALPLPPPLHFLVVEALVAAAAGAVRFSCYEAPDMSLAALRELDVTDGILAWKLERVNGQRVLPRGRMEMVLEQCRVMLGALSTQHGLTTIGPSVAAVAEILQHCMTVLDTQNSNVSGPCSVTHVVFGRAAVAGIMNKDFFSEQVLDDVVNVIADLMLPGATQRYSARIEGAKLMQSAFAKYVDPSMIFEAIVSGGLGLASQGADVPAEHLETAIFMLGETAAACGELELRCLVKIVHEAAVAPACLPLALATVDWLARALSYPDRHAYASMLEPQLMYDCLVKGLSIDALVSVRGLVAPSEAAAASPHAFAQACAGSLVGPMVLMQDEMGFARLADLAGSTVKALLEHHIAAVFGVSYPGLKSGNASTRRMCREVYNDHHFLVRTLGPGYGALINNAAVTAVGKMLTEARDPLDSEDPSAEPNLPFYRPSTVVETTKDLMPGQNAAEKEERLWATVLGGSQIAQLLLNVQELVNRARHPRHLTTAKGALRAVLLLLDARVAHPATLRYVLSLLLRMLREPSLRSTCCALLGCVIGHVWGAGQPAIDTLGAALPPLVSAVVEALTDCRNKRIAAASTASPEVAALDQDFNQLTRLLENLTVRIPGALRGFLRQVDPIPAERGLEAAAEAVKESRQALDPVQQLAQFASRAASMPLPLRRRSLKALRALLREQPESLYEGGAVVVSAPERRFRNEAPGAKRVAARPAPAVAAAAWQLAKLSSEVGDPQLAVFAGELLAVVGPLDPGKLAFASEPSSVSTTAVAAAAVPGRGRRAAPGVVSCSERGVQATWVAVLRMLCDYLIDEETSVVGTAQHTLRALMARKDAKPVEANAGLGRRLMGTVEGQAAFAELDQNTSDFLSVYASDREPAVSVQDDSAMQTVLQTHLWDLTSRPYAVWVCELAFALLKRADSPPLHACANMALHKPSFAEAILPLAFADLALHGPAEQASLDRSRDVAYAIAKGVLPACSKHPKAMRLLLRCLHHVRSMYLGAVHTLVAPHQAKSKLGTLRQLSRSDAAAWRKAYWVDLDYLRLAAAAVACRAHFSALLYVEAWAEDASGGRLAMPSPQVNARSAEADALLLEIYSRIEEPDGLYAVARTNELLPQLRRFERQGNWAQALVTCDLALQVITQQEAAAVGGSASSVAAAGSAGGITRQAAEAGRLRCLSNLGAANLMALVTRTQGGVGGSAGTANHHRSGTGTTAAAAATAAAHSLGSWAPLNPGTSAEEENSPTSAALSAAVSALETGGAERCSQAVSSARRALVAALATAGLESTGDVNPALVLLQMLHAVTEAWDIMWPGLGELSSVGSPAKKARPGRGGAGNHGTPLERPGSAGRDTAAALERTLRLWGAREEASGAGGRYSLLAPLQDLRRELLRVMRAPAEEGDCLMQSAAAARKTGHFGQATGCLLRLRSLAAAAASPELAAMDAPWRLEESKVLWAQGQKDSALSTVRSLLAAISAAAPASARLPYFKAVAAKWMAESRTESAAHVEAMLTEAYNATVRATSENPHACRIVYRLAQFTGGLYRSIQERKASPEWATAQAVIQQKREQLEEREAAAKAKRPGVVADREMQRNIVHLRRQLESDIEEQKAMAQREGVLLEQSLLAYGHCLLAGNNYDLPAVFRVVEMWLTGAKNHRVNQHVAEVVQNVASHKFLPLVSQVASRLSSSADGSGFQKVLQKLLIRLGTEHPFHSLLQVLALKNGNRDAQGRVTDPKKAGEGNLAFVADEEKVAAAARVLQLVAVQNGRCKEIVGQLETAVEGYISLAAAPVGKYDKEFAFPAAFRRQLIRQLQAIPVLSASIPLDYSLAYNDLPLVANVDETVSLMDGVNRPKLVKMVDSRGDRRWQLVKGGDDDMRQDAVMQQFFGLLNAFLADAPATGARSLKIRTYRVVPFTPAAGLLEWVNDTKRLMDCLFVTRERYRLLSSDLQFFKKVSEAHRGNTAKLRPAFDRVVAGTPPEMHRWFLHEFREPGSWFEARLAYTRSVAVNSMAGHIIGLGDRHCNNILLDQATAEVVHIDLGIAFEQGKLLITPERVPFRLTAGVVDGMGVTGVEGVMRRCCEETMRVLRVQKEAIMTVMEVLIHDPLYRWALSLVDVNKRQRLEEDGAQMEEEQQEEGPAGAAVAVPLVGTADANRTLLRIKQKLEGVEGADSGARSVEGQVAHLFSEAMDPDNLCRMYCGWLPMV